MNNLAKLALTVAHDIQSEVVSWEASVMTGATKGTARTARANQRAVPDGLRDRNYIYSALLQISEPLANSYAQVKEDLEDTNRVSWAGTAHEIREVLATMLRELAPDDSVKSRSWYKQEPDTSGPTQKQRVRYILQMRGAGSKELKVGEQVSKLDAMIEDLVRDTYSRASDAAHRFKTRAEVQRIMRYFEVFAQDLLNL
jgi:hypothetical protein